VNQREPSPTELLKHARFLRREALTCGKAGAYLAAALMAGAAMEAVLLATVLESTEQGVREAGWWPRSGDKGGLVRASPRRWSLANLIDCAWLAGWLDAFEIDEIDLENEAQVLRGLRNLVAHPLLYVSDPMTPYVFDRREFRDVMVRLKLVFDATAVARKDRAVPPPVAPRETVIGSTSRRRGER